MISGFTPAYVQPPEPRLPPNLESQLRLFGRLTGIILLFPLERADVIHLRIETFVANFVHKNSNKTGRPSSQETSMIQESKKQATSEVF